MPQVSPNGRQIAYLSVDATTAVMNLFVHDVGTPSSAVQVTFEAVRPIRVYRWAETSAHLLYVQDLNGNETFHLYVVDLATMTTVNRTPFPNVKVQASFQLSSMSCQINRLTSSRCPQEVVIGLNQRNPAVFDVFRLHIVTGELTLLASNPGSVDAWVVDYDLQVRARIQHDDSEVWTKSLWVCNGDTWRVLASWGLDDQVEPLQLTADGSGLYITSTLAHTADAADPSPQAANPKRLGRLLLLSIDESAAAVTIASHAEGDVAHVEFHPVTGLPDFATVESFGHAKIVLQPAMQSDLAVLAAVAPGTVSIVSRSADDNKWTVSIASDHHSLRYYLYDRTAQAVTLLGLERPLLEQYTFAPMQPVRVPCSDGESMVAYLTLPLGNAVAAKLPMVLNVHGGPWGQDVWGFNRVHQWFANRGYAVISVNFRGSEGYGMRWLNLGNQEWGRRMQQDLTDTVNWAIGCGYVDASRIGIYGGSYGGYAVLAGLAFTPDVFACGVDIVGPSNIKTLLDSTPPDWAIMKKEFAVRIGDVSDAAFNRRISPLFHVAAMKAPVLIGQGANDPRVVKSESDQVARELFQAKHDVTYIVYPDEGHGFCRPPNNIDFCYRTERFLANHLGGRVGPVDDGVATKNHTAIVVDLATL
ncbi:hypothetical protein DYB38_008612 [Aphanomyces astaci]|uniref:Prolyl endopeptidase n=1 Tax=Aphanomyces astaci TaxID=112090 RepID=A0A397DZY5_APHAT|nr:hypothetical protein DYB38_008612 [Aphanomyces astaci]